MAVRGFAVGLFAALVIGASAPQVQAEQPVTFTKDVLPILQESCQTCHAQFMPYGFAFGKYNALGAIVSDYNGRPIDTVVENVPVGDTTHSFRDAIDVIDTLAELPATSQCFVRNVVRYILGQSHGTHVDGLTTNLSRPFQDSGQDIPVLIAETLASPDLYFRRRSQ